MTKPQLQSATPGRNHTCSCGSGKKFKKCCGQNAPQSLPRVTHTPPQFSNAASLWALAKQSFEAKKHGLAQTYCDELLALDPHHADALHLRALLAYQQGEYAIAQQFVQRAIQRTPRVSTFYNSLGFILKAQKRWDEAVQAYRKALQFNTKNAQAHYNLGELLATCGDSTAAQKSYREALQCQPDFHEAHNNLGLLLYAEQQYDKAIIHFAKAVQSRPQEAAVYIRLARALCKLQRYAEAKAVTHQAIQIQPTLAEAWHNWGVSLHSLGDVEAAIKAYETAVELQPDFCESYLNLGSIYYEQGLSDVAREYFQRAAAVNPLDSFTLRQALCVPAFYDSLEQAKTEREQLLEKLTQLEQKQFQIHSPEDEIALSPFFLAYQGGDATNLLSRIGDLLLTSSPALGTIAPHCQATRARDGRIEIGFISHCFSRAGHIVNRVMAGILANWPRDQFRVTVIHSGVLAMELRPALREGDRVLQVSAQSALARQQIAAAALDILFYSDIGMDSWTYFLSFARLAPLQLVTSGHPITSGVPGVDYFLSAANDELPHAQQHYRETLIQWAQRPVCYMPIERVPTQKTRADFGLAENRHVYICPMTPYKLHPANDALFAEILRTDAEGELLFITNHQTALWERLQQRFAHVMPDVTERIRYLPFMPRTDLAQLLALSDVMLDPLIFNGGTTSLEALAVGTPIVTLPGEFLRQRGTFALYNCMDFTDVIAKDENDYVRLATEIGRRPDYREHLKQEILTRKAGLFWQTNWIQPFSEFLGEQLARR